jgi:L-ribulose-5-phosphate 3-epimerase
MHRRQFLAVTGTAALAASTSLTKSITNVIFPRSMPLADQFREAKNAGFQGIEIRLGEREQLNVTTSRDDAMRIGDAARSTGIEIVSLWVSDPLSANPLNHSDPALRAKGVDALHQAIDVAKAVGCGALLIVPGRIGEGPRFRFGYQDSWDRISAELRKLIPHATEAKVLLTPENVWNKFLVSPLEMRAFVDQFQSPWLQTHFDIGNVMQFGYPQDWILTLGPRIKRLHAKDYKLSERAEQGRFVDLLEGDVQWKEVMAALNKIGYRGFISPEYGYNAQEPGYIKKISKALDQILEMA